MVQRTLREREFADSSAATLTKFIGIWLSLVERTLGVGEVGGSNPLIPTKIGCLVARRKSLGLCRLCPRKQPTGLGVSQARYGQLAEMV